MVLSDNKTFKARKEQFTRNPLVSSIGQLHDKPSRHVEEGERRGNLLVLKETTVGGLVPIALEVDEVCPALHFVDLDVHAHGDDLFCAAVAELRHLEVVALELCL